MEDIYRHASEVIIWMGRPSINRRTEEHAIALIHQLQGSENSKSSSTTVFDWREDLNLEYWQAIKEVLAHPWFERLWVQREYTCARQTTALFQYHRIAFENIGWAATTIYQESYGKVTFCTLLARAPDLW